MKTAVPSLLLEFAAQIRSLCEAEGTAVLVHLEPPRQDNLVLARSGEVVAPEFSDDEAAWAFVSGQYPGSDPSDRQSIRQQVSQDGLSTLICVPLARVLSESQPSQPQEEERRAFPVVHVAPRLDGNIWIAVTGDARTDRLSRLLTDLDGDLDDDERRLAHFVSLSARLAWQVYHLYRSLQDPVSRLAGRKEFDTYLTRALVAARANAQPLGLLLINPDDFVMVNHRYGREQGDQAVREVAARLENGVRDTDGVFRYGGAVFGVILPATDLESSRVAARKYRQLLSDEAYLDGALNLEFTIGGAAADLDYLSGAEPDPLDVLQRADKALNQAKLAGGARQLLVAMSDSDAGLDHFDPLSGIFTTDSEKDYRNMLLLWEAVSLVSTTSDPEQLAIQFVDRLGSRFHPDRLALVRCGSDTGSPQHEVLATSVRDDSTEEGRVLGRTVRLEAELNQLIQRACESGKLERLRNGDSESPLATTCFAVPLLVGTRRVGCLVLEGMNRRLDLDSTDLMFLNALANQLAIALDRAELSANWMREKDRESRQLREQVQELRQAVSPQEPVYESEQMADLMALIRRVAPSNATVLIIGESGTGKEMLAQSVHQHSDRRDRPFVTVDCGAIAHTLLETELFGHVKGAYTGAQSAAEGRIAQADGGTLFLDEIGELPLDLQTKLLRFVQEREFTPVGSNRSRHVDVRIVAATNRELKDEVADGRFRQDLYYRLQVVSVQAVPLRERPADIMPLARTFLSRFAAQNQSRCSEFSDDAERKLLQHNWPGNVRELQHTVLRALLMCESEVLEAGAIELLPESMQESVQPVAVEDPPSALESSDPASMTVAASPKAGNAPVSMDPVAALRSELAWQVQQALLDNASHPVPIGRWLRDDLVLAVSEACGEVARRAARMVGVPESTFRRQLEKARAEADAGLAARTEAWARMRDVLAQLVTVVVEDYDGKLLEEARMALLETVMEREECGSTVGAALMGVTPPTFKRWIGERAA